MGIPLFIAGSLVLTPYDLLLEDLLQLLYRVKTLQGRRFMKFCSRLLLPLL